MAENQLSPDVMRMLADQQKQINELKRKPAPSVLVPIHAPPFSYAGAIALASSGRWYPTSTIRLVSVVVSLDTAGTSDTVVTIYRNGVSLGTITLGSGVHKNSASFNTVFAALTDYLSVDTATVGTGSPAELVVQPVVVAA